MEGDGNGNGISVNGVSRFPADSRARAKIPSRKRGGDFDSSAQSPTASAPPIDGGRAGGGECPVRAAVARTSLGNRREITTDQPPPCLASPLCHVNCIFLYDTLCRGTRLTYMARIVCIACRCHAGDKFLVLLLRLLILRASFGD